jgi:hypothetical protein
MKEEEEEEDDDSWSGKDNEERVPISRMDGKFIPSSAIGIDLLSIAI